MKEASLKIVGMFARRRRYPVHWRYPVRLRRVKRLALLTALWLAVLASLLPVPSGMVNAQGSHAMDANLNERAPAAGYGGGSSASAGNVSVLQTTDQPDNQPGLTATLESITFIETVTPAADGSIVHIVKPGEFIITIAQAYKIPLIDIFSLNNITDQTVIYPGQKLLLKRADRTPEPTVTETVVPTTPPPPTATPTRRPTRTPLQTGSEVSEPAIESASSPGETATAISQPVEPAVKQDNTLDLMLMTIGGLFAFGAAMILLGAVLRRRS